MNDPTSVRTLKNIELNVSETKNIIGGLQCHHNFFPSGIPESLISKTPIRFGTLDGDVLYLTMADNIDEQFIKTFIYD